MTRLISTVLFLIISASALDIATVSAQSRDFDCIGKPNSTEESRLVLSKVQARYTDVQQMQGLFAQESYLASLDVREESQGEIYFNRPGSMRWEYLSPEKQTFLLHKDTIYFYQPEDKQLVVDTLREVLISDLPLAFLMGIGSLDKDFKLVSSCKSAGGTVLTLTPLKKGIEAQEDSHTGELAELKLLIKDGEYIPAGARVVDQSGNVTAVVFSEIVVNGSNIENRFIPDFPKGIDVHDRRKEKNE